MTLQEFDDYCASLPATEMVVQWGGAHVWKIGGKVFALAARWGEGVDDYRIGFKASEMAFMMLTDQPGFAPLPYLGRYKWVQIQDPDVLSREETANYLQAAYRQVCAKLPRARRNALGL